MDQHDNGATPAPRRGPGRPPKKDGVATPRPVTVPVQRPRRGEATESSSTTQTGPIMIESIVRELEKTKSDNIRDCLMATAESLGLYDQVHNPPSDNDGVVRGPNLEAVQRRFPLLEESSCWTAADRANAVSKLETIYGQVSDNDKTRCLYAACLCALGCLPEDIISIDYGLKYAASDDHPGAEYEWAEEFCERLSDIVTHPAFHPSTLALALQYVVILVTNDTRRWGTIPSRGNDNDVFMKCLLRVSQASKPGITIWKVREEVARSQRRDNFTNTLYETLEAVVMEYYAGRASTESPSRPQPQDGFYLVSEIHLKFLQDALFKLNDGILLQYAPMTLRGGRIAETMEDLPAEEWTNLWRHCILRDIERRIQAGKKIY